MLAVLFKQRLKTRDEVTKAPLQPRDVLAAVNDALLEDVTAPCMFLTAAYGLLDMRTNDLTIASAGHPPVLLQRSGGEIQSIKPPGPALGLSTEATFHEENLHLDSGDRLLLYTDGLLETLDGGSDASSNAFDRIALALRETESGHRLLRELVSGPNGPSFERDDITAVMIAADAGSSRFEHGVVERAVQRRTLRREPVVFYGEAEGTAFFSVRGKGTWSFSVLLYETARALLGAGRRVFIDLDSCEYLDSTFLGTIHELIASAQPKTAVLQRVPQVVQALFEELSMERVMEQIRTEPLPLPERMIPLREKHLDDDTQRSRLQRAHEALASLSPTNREQFQAVIDSLREERRE